MKTHFITGVTGTLGKKYIEELLDHTSDKLILLIRRKNRFSHWDRARKILSACGHEVALGTRVEVLEGDVTSPNLGLSTSDAHYLIHAATHFHHIAALTALNGSEEECQKINVNGTLHALDLAKKMRENGKLERFYYFSTAYVPGSLQVYHSKEDILPEKPAHANFYESSKYAAETHVRAAMKTGLAITIFRPSIVVGDSQTGEVSEFNVIYPFMKLFVHGIISKLPAHPENSFNIVPIDFVIKAARQIMFQPNSIGKTYHLVTENPPTIDMLLRLKNEEYPSIPNIQLIPPDHFSKDNLNQVEQQVYDILQPYLGYLNDGLTFDMSNTRQALEGTGLEFPNTGYNFLRILTRYAINAGYLLV